MSGSGMRKAKYNVNTAINTKTGSDNTTNIQSNRNSQINIPTKRRGKSK
jgi:hypothetical protein